jgi:hypothetical protein
VPAAASLGSPQTLSLRRVGGTVGLLPLLALACLVGWFARWGPDWPAQEYRAWTAQHFGLTAWSNFWYSGIALPGYSVLYPVIAAVFGTSLTGVAAVLVAARGAGGLAPTGARIRRVGFQVSVGFVLIADLLIGQIPYLIGIACGVWSVRAVRSGRPWLAAVLAAACSLSSPLAGAFLLIATPSLMTAFGIRRCAPLLGAGLGVLVSALIGGAGGPFPFEWHHAASSAAFVALVVGLTRPQDRPVRVFALSYALAAVLAGLVPNPIGGNVVRLAQLAALPMAWHLLASLRIPRLLGAGMDGTRSRGRRAVVLGGALVLLAASWPAVPAVSSIGRGAGDPSQAASYYTGLRQFLGTQDPARGRVEVVFTREHWEALWVAQVFPIARGWERQTDLQVNQVLYHRLTPARYRRWLDDHAVALVALPRAPIDYGGEAEAELLRHPPKYLVPVWHDSNWQVWRVSHPQPLVSGAATLVSMGPASVVLDFRHAGRAMVRIRANSMWQLDQGSGCISATRGGWLAVSVRAAQTVTLRSRLGIGALDGDAVQGCS